MADGTQYVRQSLKSVDSECYLTCLYLPESIRELAMTLYAFDAEISRIPSLVSEPMPGEIRIQWWRDLIKSGGNAGSGPLAETLLEVIEKNNLPRDVFDNYLEAKIFDLYQDAMPDMASYEGYLGETVSSFLHMLAIAHGMERSTTLADACGHAGVAIGIARHLSFCAYARAREQLYFPSEILQKHTLNREIWLSKELKSEHDDVVLEMSQLAKNHLDKAKMAIVSLQKEIHAVFLPLAFSGNALRIINKNPSFCLQKPVILSPIRQQWVAFRGLRLI